jgi:hypothetical protein
MKQTNKTLTRIGFSIAAIVCLAAAASAALTYVSMPALRASLICASTATAGLTLWLMGVTLSSLAAQVRMDLKRPLACVAQPRYFGPILMAASTLTFAYANSSLQQRVAPVLHNYTRVAEANPLPPIKLKGIILNGSHSLAFINGKFLQAGATLNGVLIAEINPTSVAVEFNGQKKLITLSN